MCIREIVAASQMVQPAHVRVRQAQPTRVSNPFQRVVDLQPARQIDRSPVRTRTQPQQVLNPSALPSPVPVRQGDRRSQPSQDSVIERRRAEVQPRQNTRVTDPVPVRTGQPVHAPVGDIPDEAAQADRWEAINREKARLKNLEQTNRQRSERTQQQSATNNWNFQPGNQPVALPPTDPLRLATQLLRPGPLVLVNGYVDLLRRSGFAIEPVAPPPMFTPSLPPLPLPPAPDFSSPFDNDWSNYDGQVRGILIQTSGYIERQRYLVTSGGFQFADRTWLPYVPSRDEIESIMAGLTWEVIPPLGYDPPFEYVGGSFVYDQGYQFQPLIGLEDLGSGRRGRDSWSNTDLTQYQPGETIYRELTVIGGLQQTSFPIAPVSGEDLAFWRREVEQPNWNWIGTNPGANASIGYLTNLSVVVHTDGNIPSVPTSQPFIPIICRGDQQMQCEARILIPLLKDIKNLLTIAIKGRDCEDEADRVFGRGLEGLSNKLQVAVTESCSSTLAVPELWENKPAKAYPQAGVIFGNKLPNGKIGRERRTLHIPHYRLGEGVKPAIPSYQRGSYWARLIMEDNSKIYCYAASENEAVRVVEALRLLARRDLDPGTRPATGKVGYAKTTWEAVPLYIQYFATGKAQQNFDWEVRLRS